MVVLASLETGPEYLPELQTERSVTSNSAGALVQLP